MSRIAVLFCILLLAVSATGQVQSFGETSFAVPSGWEYGAEPSADHATLSMSQGGQVVAMAVFRSLRAAGNPDRSITRLRAPIHVTNTKATRLLAQMIGPKFLPPRIGSCRISNTTSSTSELACALHL